MMHIEYASEELVGGRGPERIAGHLIGVVSLVWSDSSLENSRNQEGISKDERSEGRKIARKLNH